MIIFIPLEVGRS